MKTVHIVVELVRGYPRVTSFGTLALARDHFIKLVLDQSGDVFDECKQEIADAIKNKVLKSEKYYVELITSKVLP